MVQRGLLEEKLSDVAGCRWDRGKHSCSFITFAVSFLQFVSDSALYCSFNCSVYYMRSSYCCVSQFIEEHISN